ncbi:hypothetical protein RchiOBHm_Chr2g0165251 [Rosa chinensis]|uniref:Uncharacterized protein n=1 Tax=Rosa chinensis TaxID=74649 RepID=A0A2P6S3T1_ROSCH|nr:hypothetical protein RchiOBHm_Chr2g0165251 [Rosa chinensis]
MKPPSRHHPPCAVIVKSCFKDSRSTSQALHHPLPSWCNSIFFLVISFGFLCFDFVRL